jgi:hypothetical protein
MMVESEESEPTLIPYVHASKEPSDFTYTERVGEPILGWEILLPILLAYPAFSLPVFILTLAKLGAVVVVLAFGYSVKYSLGLR